MTIADLTFERIDKQPIRRFRKAEWNALAEMLRRANLPLTSFRQLPSDNESSWGGLVHIPSDTSVECMRHVKLGATTIYPGSWVRFSGPEVGHSNLLRSVSPILTFGHFRGALQKEFLPFVVEWENEKLVPDLWNDFVSQPASDAATIWTPEHRFKQEEVDDFKQRMERAFSEIAELKLLSAEAFATLRTEANERAPKVGKDWGSWREIYVGWIFGMVADGIIGSHVVRILFSAATGYLAAKMGLTPHIPLLP